MLNRFVVKKVDVVKFKNIFNPHFIEHTKNFNLFTVCTSLRFDDDNDPRNQKRNISNNVTYTIQSEHSSTFTTELASDFLHRVITIYLSHECCPEIIPQIEIVFMSDSEDITREHYLQHPKSMLCRKLIRRYHEPSSQDFEYKWLSDSFKKL